LARAKQTTRADARRRYRQAVAQAVEPEDAGDESAESAATSSKPAARSGARPAAGQPGRPGLGTAFRNSYRAPNYREDLRALPQLVRGKWFLIAIGLTALGWVLYLGLPNAATVLLWTVVSVPVGGPTVPVFLVGFTAPRASYLLGLGLGVANLIVTGIAILIQPGIVSTGIGDALIQGVIYGLPTAVIFAAGAAWYRRFLNLSNPRLAQGAKRGGGGGRSKAGSKASARR
jgi:hypothetical protein